MGVDMVAEIERRASEVLRAIPQSERYDIYVISFFIYDDEDDPRRPTLTIGYNTETNCRDASKKASDRAEARWNYAYWLQNALIEFGLEDTAPLLEAWVKELGRWYSDAEEEADFDRCLEIGEQITPQFVDAACAAAARLHERGVVTTVFGRALPIIIHELEYYELIAEQTRRANPKGVADDFVAWVMSF